MAARRVFMVTAAAAALVIGLAGPAPARGDAVQRKAVTGVGGRSGTVSRYVDRRDGRSVTSVSMTADDVDGGHGRCTETWVDYSTKPHQHLNPGLLVNCSGGTRSVSGAVSTDYDGVVGMSVVVCEVPDTAGRITRDESNCRGGLSGMSLHSGRRYDEFEVHAPVSPSGVRIWRV